MTDLFTLYFFRAYNGRPMQCPRRSINSYFRTIEEMFGLSRRDAERVLRHTHISTEHATFWSVNSGSANRERVN